jgi:hypothetical protein
LADRRFYFWESYGKALDLLTDEEAGRFIKACCAFAFDGIEPDFSDDSRMAFAWQIVSAQITTSIEIGIKNAERGRRGGKKSGESRKKSKGNERSAASSTASTTASSDMNMNMNVGAAASLDGSASAPDPDGGDSDEY